MHITSTSYFKAQSFKINFLRTSLSFDFIDTPAYLIVYHAEEVQKIGRGKNYNFRRIKVIINVKMNLIVLVIIIIIKN